MERNLRVSRKTKVNRMTHRIVGRSAEMTVARSELNMTGGEKRREERRGGKRRRRRRRRGRRRRRRRRRRKKEKVLLVALFTMSLWCSSENAACPQKGKKQRGEK